MERTDAVVIGAGQAGLSMSRCLSGRGIDHVVLERGRVAERWRSERWDSLKLLTPNWQSRLPGFRYEGPDPDGYMSMPEVVDYLERYAALCNAPVRGETRVRSVARQGEGYRIETDQGDFASRAVVIATGACDRPFVPALAQGLHPDVHQLTPTRYRNPAALPDGGVLVVGASASGIQLADELRRAGRQVTLSVAEHTRVPRTYRGRDILWWLDRMGTLDRAIDEMGDTARARREPSLQLIGSDERRNLDLGLLQERGVRLVGRTVAADGRRVSFANDLALTTGDADRRLFRQLERIDAFAAAIGVAGQLPPGERPRPVPVGRAPSRLNLAAEGISTVIWATGFRPHYPWLQVPVLDARGGLCHVGGVLPAPGLYVLGLPFMRRRKSTFIDGVGDDARDLAQHLSDHLDRGQRVAA